MSDNKGCPSSKKRYDTEDDALWAARDGMLFRGTPKLEVYWCILCDLGILAGLVIKKPNEKRNKLHNNYF